MKQWFILEWVGKWVIPDDAHGGVVPGPYRSRALAQERLERGMV